MKTQADNMHIHPEKQPFQGNGTTPKPKTASSRAAHPTAAGSKDVNMVSANANPGKGR